MQSVKIHEGKPCPYLLERACECTNGCMGELSTCDQKAGGLWWDRGPSGTEGALQSAYIEI